MFLVTYEYQSEKHFAFLVEGWLYNCHEVHGGLPIEAETFLSNLGLYRPIAIIMHYSLSIGASGSKINRINAEEVGNLLCVYEEQIK